MALYKLAVLISGNGSNLQAVIDACEWGEIPGTKVALVVSNREGVFGLQRAKRHGIPHMVIPKENSKKLLESLDVYDIDAVILAGYLSIVPKTIIKAYSKRIINIHPALLPKYGGMGYYGKKVHEAVLAAGERFSGATAHIVDDGVDTGAILVQGEVPVLDDDTAETLQQRVLKIEHKVLVQAVKELAAGTIENLIKYPLMITPKQILIVGSGGREHAIGWKLKQNPEVELFFAPGNGGTSQIGENLDIKADEIDRLADFAEKYDIYLTVVGPELPLVLGIADVFRKRGLWIFAPDSGGARLEGSKAFAKQFMNKYNIPTAAYDEVTSVDAGIEVLNRSSYPVVIKADGIAAGKGVIICENRENAEKALKDMLEKQVFGDAGKTVVIEEYMTGQEVSLLCFTDSKTIIPMESASDYKRALDNDEGLNTGGMGSISPSPYYTPGMADHIAQRTLEGIKAEGFDYRGVIYIGLMLTDDGPKVLEYNARFGDPETEALMPRLKSDLLEIMDAVSDKRIATIRPSWRKEQAVCVILASKGYPGKYKTGHEITIPDMLKSNVFHAGTSEKDGKTVTDGGRVLAVTALGKDLQAARNTVYKDIDKINFDGKSCRTDIGKVKSD